MMKNQSKALVIFFTLVLLLSMASSVILGADGHAPPKLSPSSSTQEKERNKEGDGDGVDQCKSSDSKEECLVKRTLAAHTDYIYTQDLKSSP
ncbi:phytosulfokines 1-like [Raphanus sativus]|uniref:Phytosulfokine n=1 Tax=Raphanus sativus TaxID=3726 RepID=A0A6J0NNK4_RAPSA|nr:phytosulfokines 1-like [Raphanus sativus]XP_056863262.1 phytosulfokines 1-like [Raphanus sativus]XP_056863265.1 phytosulfokines 1-like [Raphanus sativus]